jgi:hypothetical protein
VKEKQTPSPQQQQQQYPKVGTRHDWNPNVHKTPDVCNNKNNKLQKLMIQMRFPSLGCPSNHEPTLNKRGTTITTCLDFSV